MSGNGIARLGWRRLMLVVVSACAVAMWPACATSDLDPVPSGDVANLDFTLKDMHGADVELSSFKGKPIILNFWATWCGPCKAEIPALVELVDRYKKEQLTVLGVSVDDAPDDLKKFAAEYKMNYPVLVGLGQDTFQETYDAVVLIPVTWFIRPDGTVLRKHQGPATKDWLDAQIKTMLGAAAVETH
jgi:thiol-disulfide isomerase/thioredoxin